MHCPDSQGKVVPCWPLISVQVRHSGLQINDLKDWYIYQFIKVCSNSGWECTDGSKLLALESAGVRAHVAGSGECLRSLPAHKVPSYIYINSLRSPTHLLTIFSPNNPVSIWCREPPGAWHARRMEVHSQQAATTIVFLSGQQMVRDQTATPIPVQ